MSRAARAESAPLERTRMLSASDVAELLAVSTKQANRLIRAHMVHFVVGDRLRVSESALHAYLQRFSQAPPQPDPGEERQAPEVQAALASVRRRAAAARHRPRKAEPQEGLKPTAPRTRPRPTQNE